MDLAITNKGDLILDPTGDFDLVEDLDLRRQSSLITLFINAPDFYSFPTFGANLEDFLGLSMTKGNLQRIYRSLMASLPEAVHIELEPDPRGNRLAAKVYYLERERPVRVTFALDSGLMVDDSENKLCDMYEE